LTSLGDLLHFFVCEAKVYILGFQVCVDDLADSVKIVQAHQALLSHDSH